ncbi:MAG TPA: hypothetical protein VHD91_08400 [Gaiellaceae bacterium]|nr:hypothetical protein [Gaiellaceae bacterium]
MAPTLDLEAHYDERIASIAPGLNESALRLVDRMIEVGKDI